MTTLYQNVNNETLTESLEHSNFSTQASEDLPENDNCHLDIATTAQRIPVKAALLLLFEYLNFVFARNYHEKVFDYQSRGPSCTSQAYLNLQLKATYTLLRDRGRRDILWMDVVQTIRDILKSPAQNPAWRAFHATIKFSGSSVTFLKLELDSSSSASLVDYGSVTGIVS